MVLIKLSKWSSFLPIQKDNYAYIQNDDFKSLAKALNEYPFRIALHDLTDQAVA